MIRHQPPPTRGFTETVNWAETLRKLDRNEEALEKYRQAVEADPSEVWTYLDWAETLRKLDRNEEALAVYAQALEKVPRRDHAQVYGVCPVCVQKITDPP